MANNGIKVLADYDYADYMHFFYAIMSVGPFIIKKMKRLQIDNNNNKQIGRSQILNAL